MRPRLLDGYCGEGGAGMGYSLAGFEVVGVDLSPQPRYPFEFVQGDAVAYIAEHGAEFDVIHTSPPCLFAQNLNRGKRAVHTNWIPATRAALQKVDRPFVIENVPAARRLLLNPVLLCGSMFGLGVVRHRYFEVWPVAPWLVPSCRHVGHPVLISGVSRIKGRPRIENSAAECRAAAGLEWMTRKGMDQAIPPAFTEFIGRFLLGTIGVVND